MLLRTAWRAIKQEATERSAWIVSAVVSIGVTVVHLIDTYDEFFTTTFWRLPTLLLIAVNIFFTWLAVVVFSAAVKPTRKVIYAILVAASFQAVIAADLEVQPLSGADSVGGTRTIRLGEFYTPIEQLLSGEIDEPVERKMRAEITALRNRYNTADSITTLRADLADRVGTERSLDVEGRVALLKRLDEILDDTTRPLPAKLREVANELYAESLREIVQDLGRPA